MDHWHQDLSGSAEEQSLALEGLRAYLTRVLPAALSGRASTDHSFISDIVQMTLIRASERKDSFQGRSRFTSWVMAIALRIAFNEIRRKEWNNVSLDQLREQQGTFEGEQDPLDGPGERSEQRDLARMIREVIMTDLTAKQRDVLLCELSGMPQDEIARQLSTTRNNIYKLFHDARKALRRALEARGFSGNDFTTSERGMTV